MQESNPIQEWGEVDFHGACDVAYVYRGKERYRDERKNEKVFFWDIDEPRDPETSESGKKNWVSVEEMSSEGAIYVVWDLFFERMKVYVSYATGIRLEYLQVRRKDNTRGSLYGQVFSKHGTQNLPRARHTYTSASFMTLAMRCNNGSRESISYHRRSSTGSTNALHVNPTCKRSARPASGRHLVPNLKLELGLYSTRLENIKPRRSWFCKTLLFAKVGSTPEP